MAAVLTTVLPRGSAFIAQGAASARGVELSKRGVGHQQHQQPGVVPLAVDTGASTAGRRRRRTPSADALNMVSILYVCSVVGFLLR